MSAPQPGRDAIGPVTAYHVTTGFSSGTLPAEEALADWEAADEDMRDGDPETGFTLWVRGTHVRRLAPTRYTPLPDPE
jgi:hypothetical protein